MNDIIAQSLGLPTVVEEKPVAEVHNPEIDKDFEEAHEAVMTTLNRTNDAVEEAIELARQSQHHLAYQALNALLKTNLDAARELVSLHKERKIIAKMEGNTQPASTASHVTNNNLFVGTTQEMLNLIEKARKDVPTI